MDTRYVNLFTDFGFIKIFGEIDCKPILVDFLNSLLPRSQVFQKTLSTHFKIHIPLLSPFYYLCLKSGMDDSIPEMYAP